MKTQNIYDELLGAITRAITINELRQIEGLFDDALMVGDIDCTQVALLRKSITVREDTIAQLATA